LHVHVSQGGLCVLAKGPRCASAELNLDVYDCESPWRTTPPPGKHARVGRRKVLRL